VNNYRLISHSIKGFADYVYVTDQADSLDADTLTAVEAAARVDGLTVGGKWVIQGWRLQEVPASSAKELAKVLRDRLGAKPVADQPEGPA
jgi:hypothetical protein